MGSKRQKRAAAPAPREEPAETEVAAPVPAAEGRQAIDALFRDARHRKEKKRDAEAEKQARAESAAVAAAAAAASKAPGRRKRGRQPDAAKPLRYDAESGLPVYSSKDLCIGRGGGTPLCPFDCDCCF